MSKKQKVIKYQASEPKKERKSEMKRRRKKLLKKIYKTKSKEEKEQRTIGKAIIKEVKEKFIVKKKKCQCKTDPTPYHILTQHHEWPKKRVDQHREDHHDECTSLKKNLSRRAQTVERYLAYMLEYQDITPTEYHNFFCFEDIEKIIIEWKKIEEKLFH